MFVIICENTDEAPDIWGPFGSEREAQEWLDSDQQDNNCPNEHFIQPLWEAKIV